MADMLSIIMGILGPKAKDSAVDAGFSKGKDAVKKYFDEDALRKKVESQLEKYFQGCQSGLDIQDEFDYQGLLNASPKLIELAKKCKVGPEREHYRQQYFAFGYTAAQVAPENENRTLNIILASVLNTVLEADDHIVTLKAVEEILARIDQADTREAFNTLNAKVDFIYEKMQTSTPAFPIPKCLTPVPMVDYAVGLVGRETTVANVLKHLEEKSRLALVNGLGGIGKTAVMKWICNEIKDQGHYVAWIDCGESLREDLMMLRESLGISEKDPDTAYAMLLNALKTRLDGDLYLFMDDLSRQPNAEELRELNSLNAHVMVTSRQKNSAFPTVDLDVLEPEAALTMFFKYYNGDSGRQYETAAEEIVNSAQRHTLLVELLAKAARKAGGPLEDFSKNLAREGVFDVFKRRLRTSHDEDENLTIEECVMRLYAFSRLSDEQKRIMKLFSIFTPEKDIYWELPEWAGLDMDAVDALVDLGWLERLEPENNYKNHQIIKDSLERQLKSNGEVLKFEEYGELLSKVADTESYMPKKIEYTKVRGRLVLAEDIAKYLMNRTDRMLEKAAIAEDETNVLEYAAVLYHNLAGVYSDHGGYGKALEYLGKALATYERVVGTDHPDTATAYNNMAVVYEAQGDYGKALKYHRKALDIEKRVLGTDHPDTANTYHDMAVVYEAQGDNRKALECSEKALAICERIVGTEHPNSATTYNNMACLYTEQEDYVNALKYYRKALAIRKRFLGIDHLDTVTVYNNVASMFYKKVKYDKALEYYGKALAISERVLGTDHLDMAATYNNMAGVYAEQGDYGKALEYYGKALAISERVLGTDHPDTAKTYNNIARVYCKQGDYDKAKELYAKALAVLTVKLGEEHPYTQLAKKSMQDMILLTATGSGEE